MSLGVVGSDGQRMPLFWFDKGERVDQRRYMEVMNDVVVPWIEKTYGEKDIVYCFQQVQTYT